VSLTKRQDGLFFLSKMRSASDRRFTQRTLEVIAGLLQYILPQSVNVHRILQARVPIVKFSHVATGIDCDVTLENEYVYKRRDNLRFVPVYNKITKMQLEAADFAPVPPPGELDKTCTSCLILAHSVR